jgi:polyisoprenoid-binding protein YceI
MKKSFKFLLSICLISTSFATSQEQNLNQFTSQSNIRWYGEELTGVTHFGNLSFKEAQIKIQDGVISSGKFVVDMTSLTVEDLSGVGKAKLTAHLKSDDFFSTEKHPEALLTITQNAKVENGVQYLVGGLSIKEIQHPVEFTMTIVDNNSAIAQLTFDRSKYEVRFRSGSFFENLGDKLILDDIKLEANHEWH